ncbi:MAG TPA: UvrD-helicase domain-containing protein [Magnetospirillaceae bacterium]|jgi:DNA helicase-2/ATP-dependent DNA helicase PcrA
MSEAVYRALANASSGFVEAPAGCGKTEAIARAVGSFCTGRQLVLTHTHAGVDALGLRFKELGVPRDRYHIDTIAGWSWGWVRKYPENSEYRGSLEIAAWSDVYGALSRLLQKDFVRQGVLNSYSGIVVDEYQDCTVPMHQLIVGLKQLLPCRVLGDELQGIFGFRGEALVSWSDVRSEFSNDLGVLDTPYRWMKVNNETLGRWLLSARSDFRMNREPDYRHSPIERMTIPFTEVSAQLIRMTHEKTGRICIVGPKARPLPAGLETSLVNNGYRVLESNELAALREIVTNLSDGSPSEKAEAAEEFLFRAYGGVRDDDKRFISRLLKGESQRPRRQDRRSLSEKHPSGATSSMLLDLFPYLEVQAEVSAKLRDSISALKCVLEEHQRSGTALKSLYADEIARRKHLSRSRVFRSIGSTLLVKGLEFDHVVVVRNADWQQNDWGTHRDLYVALTRGSRTTTLIDLQSPPRAHLNQAPPTQAARQFSLF